MSTTWKKSCAGRTEFRFLSADRKLVRLADDFIIVQECLDYIPTGRDRNFTGPLAEQAAVTFATAPQPAWGE